MTKSIQILKWRFLAFIGTIILAVLVSQLIIHYDLQKQNEDANLINIAGRQRMLCQRIAKLTLYLHYDIQRTGRGNDIRIDTLQKTLSQWVAKHNYLIQENESARKSAKIGELLSSNTTNLEAIVHACNDLIINPTKDVADRAVTIVVDNDVPFLLLMEQTVTTYQKEAEQKLAAIKIIEWSLGGFTILVVVIGFTYIFLPSLKKLFQYNQDLAQANAELTASEEEIRSNLEQISTLQQELEVNELKYKSLIENSHDLIAVFDMNGNYTFISNSSKEIMGYEPHELIGKFGLEFVHPDDRLALVEEPLKRVFEGEKVLNPEFRLRRKNGDYIWIEAFSIPILDKYGKVVGLQTANRDITERKLIEHALKSSEERYRIVSENSQDFIALHKPDGTYTFVSPSVKNLLGYEPVELINTSGFDLIHPEDFIQIVDETRKRALTGEVLLNTQFRMRRKDGNYVWVEAYTKPILNANQEVVSVQTSARDITQRKIFEKKIIEAKEQSEKMSNQLSELLNDKNDLIGLFSHDLRSPINQIKGMVELMTLSLDDKDTVKLCLEKMGDVTAKQLLLFESILTMLKSDQISLQRDQYKTLSLVSIVTLCLENVKWQYTNKGIDLVARVPDEIYLHVHPELFSQAIHNLVTNAIKFTPTGKRVRILAWEDDHNVKIAIRDDGIGFDPVKAERLFDRFTLEGRVGTQNETSTGLGLYLVKKIITNHNGTITAESEGDGTGATFIISINKL